MIFQAGQVRRRESTLRIVRNGYITDWFISARLDRSGWERRRRRLLRFQIERRFAAGHIKRHRVMLVRHVPLAVELAIANG